MNWLKKTIKGLILTAILFTVFSLNTKIQPGLDNPKTGYLGNQAYAAELGVGGKCGAGSGNSCVTGTVCTDNVCTLVDKDQELDGLMDNSYTKQATDAKLPEGMLKNIAQTAQIVFKVFHPAIFFLTKQISDFLRPDLIYSGGMGQMLQKIWVVSRNIVNIVFVLVLLYFAIMYIFVGDDKTDPKKFIPTFALMLIAVNFSWLAGKIIIDAGNVATNIAFAIPQAVGPIQSVTVPNAGKCEITDNGKIVSGDCQPKAIFIPFDSTGLNNEMGDCKKAEEAYASDYPEKAKTENDNSGAGDSALTKSAYYQKSTICWGNRDYGEFDSTNAAYQLTYSLAKVQNLPLAQTDDIPHLAIGTIFAFVFEILYLLSFLALFIVLLFRMVFLWLMVAFSPFIVLTLFLKKSGIGLDMKALDEHLSVDQFINWAFVPAKVAVVWAIGFLMITTGQTTASAIFSRLNANSLIDVKVYNVGSVFMGMNSIEEILWLLMTMMVIWVGTFAMMKNLNVASKVIEKIQGAGEKTAKWVASAPYNAPIAPMIDIKNGGLNWNKKMSIKDTLSDLTKGYTTGTESMISTGEMRDANKRFIDPKNDAAVKELAKLKGDPGKAASKMSSITGLSNKQIKGMSQQDLTKLLSLKIQDNPSDLATAIIKGAEGGTNLPGTVTPTETKKEDPKATYEAVKKGVEDGMAKKYVLAPGKTEKQKDDKIMELAGNNITDPNKVITELKSAGLIADIKDGGAAKAPSGTPPAPAPDPKGGGKGSSKP